MPKTQLIIDTDLSIDVDDVGALCIAHALADRGEADLLAIVHDTGVPGGVGVISILNHWYGRSSLPVGAYTGPVGNPTVTVKPDWTHKGNGVYLYDLLSKFPSTIRDSSQAPSSLSVLRSSLADADDGSVTIAAIGHATNMLDLLNSRPDKHSDLTGLELVKRKVLKLVIMGGRHDFEAGQPVEVRRCPIPREPL